MTKYNPFLSPEKYDLTPGEVRDLFYYDAITGIMTWKSKPDTPQNSNFNRRIAGTKAGCMDRGRCRITISHRGVKLLYHRAVLVWAWMTGEWPLVEVDHIDTQSWNDSWSNLRLATTSQNQQNKGITASNSTGFKGVWFEVTRQKYIAEIKSNKIRRFLGRFDTPEAAHAAYVKAAAELHGEFARTQ